MVIELIIALGILLFSGLMFYETTKFPPTRFTDIGPEYWPQIVLGGMILFSLILLISIFANKQKIGEAPPEEPKPYPLNFWFAIAITVFYIKALPVVGFPIATLLFFIAFLWLLKYRCIKSICLVTVGSTILLVMLFPRLLSIPLPRGTGLFRMITLFFY
ncbi:MAG: tripartite tricarboxylate transporter TctB family protein [Bacillota bacterium]